MNRPISQIGGYQVVGEQGRGSIGVVYRAFDPRVGRTVAIELVLTEELLPAEVEEYKARFQRMVQGMAVIAHPNIISVYEVGEDEGMLFFVAEFLEGKTLQELLDQQKTLPLETIIPIYAQICSALDHLHQHKIVHRDIKPAHIVILASGLVKVAGFVIAKFGDLGISRAGIVLGTPRYMSPEQIRGRPVDGRSDIFCLGMMLYELVTGERLFGGPNITTVIYKILNENPLLDASIPPGLRHVIAKALAKRPEERYQTCREMFEDLNHCKNPGRASQ